MNTEYPRVYICSPFRGDRETNVPNAISYCRFALEQKKFPIAPHIWLPHFMDDDNPTERELAMGFGAWLITQCEEIWVFGDRISEGMAEEIKAAKEYGKPIKYFGSIGGDGI